MESEDAMRRRCGYTLLYELSKRNPKGMDDAYLLSRLDHIGEEMPGEETWVRAAMGGALMGIGKRNQKLNTAAIRVAKATGPIGMEYEDGRRCEPLNVLKHLTRKHTRTAPLVENRANASRT